MRMGMMKSHFLKRCSLSERLKIEVDKYMNFQELIIGSHQPSICAKLDLTMWIQFTYMKCYIKHIRVHSYTDKIACVRVYMKLCDICI